MAQSWHSIVESNIISHHNSSIQSGLSTAQAQQKLSQYGLNQVNAKKIKSIFSLFLSQLSNPLIYLLLISAVIAYLTGNAKDAFVIFGVVTLNAIIGTIQEGRAEMSLQALKKWYSTKTKVLRDSTHQIIDALNLVPGDIIFLSGGDYVPADSRIINCANLLTNESALTGESISIAKSNLLLPDQTPLYNRTNMLFAGTYITGGRATAIIVTTGKHTELGKIANLSQKITPKKTELEIKINKLGQTIVYASIFLFFFIVTIGYANQIPFNQIFMISLSQMVSLIPEGLSISITVALALGVQKMAKHKTIVRKLTAIEDLGSIDTICTDKTGTLTKNQMTVTDGYLLKSNKLFSVTENNAYHVLNKTPDFQNLIYACICCNDSKILPQVLNDGPSHFKYMGDPTETSLLIFSNQAGFDTERCLLEIPRLAEIQFNSDSKMMATQHLDISLTDIYNVTANANSRIKFNKDHTKTVDHNLTYITYIKGAPENLIPLAKLSSSDSDLLNNNLKFFTQKGLRVLAFGYVNSDNLLDADKGFIQFSGQVTILGLLAQQDPPREGVVKALSECYQAGIRPVMITGDHKDTAVAIAQSLKILNQNQIAIDGNELEHLSEKQLLAKSNFVSVYSRVTPKQKLQIISALQKNNHRVAMTGDGVNDAPALAQSNVGIAMGLSGTEIAKDAAKIIIADDNFSTIIDAIKQGRIIYQNIKKLLLFLMVTSIDEVIILLLALIAGLAPPLAAVQILWINLITESALTFNLIMEPAEGNEMTRPPRPSNQPLIDMAMLYRMPILILSSVISTFGWLYFRLKYQGVSLEIAQSETFTVLVMSQWFNILNVRSSDRSVFSMRFFNNLSLIIGLITALVLQGLVIYWKPLSQFFYTQPISLKNLLYIIFVASFVLWCEEARKYFFQKQSS